MFDLCPHTCITVTPPPAGHGVRPAPRASLKIISRCWAKYRFAAADDPRARSRAPNWPKVAAISWWSQPASKAEVGSPGAADRGFAHAPLAE